MNQKEKSEITISTILECSNHLFSNQGFVQTTMQDIVQSTGLSKGAIYHHFKSKEDILERLLQNQLYRINSVIQDITDHKNHTPRQRLARIITLLQDNQENQLFVNAQWVDNIPSAIIVTLRNTIGNLAPCIASLLEEGTKLGELNCRNPVEVAEVFVLLVDIWLDSGMLPSSLKIRETRILFMRDFLKKYGADFLDEHEWNQLIQALTT